MSKERELDLKDMLYWILRQWRRILVGAIVLALLLGLFQAYRGFRALKIVNAAERQAAYENELDDYARTGAQLEEKVDVLRRQLEKQLEYNEKSLLMQIDPMNKWVASIQIYFAPKNQTAPGQSFQNAAPTNHLVSAYGNFLNSSEVYEALLAQDPDIDDIRFIPEVYEVVTDPNGATITVSLAGTSEQAIRQMPEIVKAELDAQYETLRSTIGEHSYTVISESIFSTVDVKLEETQKENLKAVTDIYDQIAEAKSALSDWAMSKPPLEMVSKRSVIKQIIKYGVLGAAAGIVLMCIWYAVRYALSDTVKTDDDWKTCGISILGHIFRNEKKKKFLPGLDALVDRIFGHARTLTQEQSCAMATHSIGAALKGQGAMEAVLVGKLPDDLAETLHRQLNAAEPSVSLRCAGDVLTEPSAAPALEGVGQVILLAERYVTHGADLEQTLTLLKAWGKPVLGAVVIE